MWRGSRYVTHVNIKLSLVFVASLLAACGSNPSTRENVSEQTSQALQVCPKGAVVKGVDVSYYQGNINFAQVKASGHEFAIARTSDGTFQDPKFATYYADIKAAGMIRGSYHFFRASEDPIAQADAMLAKIGPLGVGDLPPVLDVEVTDGQSGSTVANGVVAWVNHVAAKIGRKPMVYTAPYFWGSIGAPAVNAVLWVANWQINCPNMPNGFSGWDFWQWADNESVPGIPTLVDGDEFNGDMQALQAFARPPDLAPRGNVDAIDCTHLAGWAQDEDTPTQPIAVHFYFDGPAGDSKAQGLPLVADKTRANLCKALGSCDHSFDFSPPLSMMDGNAHPVFVYAIDSSGNGDNPEIGKGELKCATPAPPVAAAHGIKRWVTSGDSMTAWKLSYLVDVAHEPDSVLAAYAKGPDFPATPTVVQADDGSPEVWVIDGKTRRHVIDPASLAAWRMTVVKWPATKVYGNAQALDWRPTPFFVIGSGPEVYFIDDAVPTTPPPNPKSDGGVGTDSGTPDAPAADSTSDSGGCNLHGSQSPMNSGWIVALALVLVAKRRARRS